MSFLSPHQPTGSGDEDFKDMLLLAAAVAIVWLLHVCDGCSVFGH